MLLRPISLFIGILVAVLASQLPEFAQQYRQRLGGTIDELHRQVERFRAEAAADKLSFDQAVDRLHKNTDDLAQQHATDMRDSQARLARLQHQQSDMVNAGPFYRILVMVRSFDLETAEHTLPNYEPAVPTTSEGLLTTVVGFFFGGGLARLLGSRFGRRQPLRPVYAGRAASREDLSRAESIRLRARINKARLPRIGSGDSREV